MTVDNTKLAEFTIKDLPPRPAGKVKFDVDFDIDVNGILRVTAIQEDDQNKAGSATVEEKDRGRFTDEQLEKL